MTPSPQPRAVNRGRCRLHDRATTLLARKRTQWHEMRATKPCWSYCCNVKHLHRLVAERVGAGTPSSSAVYPYSLAQTDESHFPNCMLIPTLTDSPPGSVRQGYGHDSIHLS